MPPKRCTSSVRRLIIASITSSTVTMPTRWPMPSTTGTRAGRIWRSAAPLSSALASGDTATGAAAAPPPAPASRGRRLISRRSGIARSSTLVRGSECRSRRSSPGCARPGGHAARSAPTVQVGRHADELGGHQRAGALLGKINSCWTVAARLGIEPRQQVGTARLLKVLEKVGDAVGRHAAQHRQDAVARQRFDDLRRIVQEFGVSRTAIASSRAG